jgi:hypothetical protein
MAMIAQTVPETTEAPEYYFKYISLVRSGDIRVILDEQMEETVALLRCFSEERSRYRYEPDKWSVRQVISHINDTERVFAFRALWFARGFTSPLPSFDQTLAMRHSHADERSLSDHVEEFQSVRVATLDFFRHLSPDAWMRRGVASDSLFTVRALAYITAGHVTHHVGILKERYFQL